MIIPYINEAINTTFKNNFINSLSQNISDTFSSTTIDNLTKHIKLVDEIYESTQRFKVELFQNIIAAKDKEFKDSLSRMQSFTVHDTRSRTIITPIGEVVITRTIYKRKRPLKGQGKYYTYIDDILGLEKYCRFDKYIAALIVEKSATVSMAKAGREVSEMIAKTIGDNTSVISRQTARNMVRRTGLNITHNNYLPKPTPNKISIMPGEKYIATQGENMGKVMVKACVIYEDITRVCKGRNRLVNKNYMLNRALSPDDLISRIYRLYDVSKLQELVIIGDGAPWINNVQNTLKLHFENHGVNVKIYLDSFHFQKALTTMFDSDKLKNGMEELIVAYDKKQITDFYYQYGKTTSTAINSLGYILNNIPKIAALLQDNPSCPMESQISHAIANLFTNRPRGYSLITLDILLQNREAYLNGLDIKNIILDPLKQKRLTYSIDFGLLDDIYHPSHENLNLKFS